MGSLANLFVRGVDGLSVRLGQLAAWMLVLACGISAGNALIRYAFNVGSNAWLEAQWYLFGAAVFLGAPALLKLNEHVRVDVIYGSRSPRTRAWIDLLGMVFVLLPVCVICGWLSIHMVHDAYVQHEVSPSAGGLLRWPIKAMIPLGFALLGLQTLAEVVKRVGYLRGTYNMDTHYERPLQ
ncbi:MAG: TRAP transporter small permease subunit [Rubrivivax sp.]|nr:MAG: TRAP transporter small permease subunit [Rubrivivax sp.]